MVLSSFMIYHRICYKLNTTGSTSEVGTAYPSGALEFDSVILFVLVTFVLLMLHVFTFLVRTVAVNQVMVTTIQLSKS
jgi:hypothetical protein